MITNTRPDEKINWIMDAHPELGERFRIIIAKSQAPEEFEAQKVLLELQSKRYHGYVTIIDLHSNSLGLCCVESGQLTTRQSIVFAYMCGIRDFVVSPHNSFYDMVPSGIALELDRPEEFIPDFTGHDGVLANFCQLSRDTINRRFRNIVEAEEMKFWQSFKILALHDDSLGRIQYEQRLALAELEKMPGGEPFTPISDSAASLLRPFGIMSRMGRPHYLHWGYNNYSNAYPQIIGYTEDGTPRKLCFGCVAMPIEPPIDLGDGWASFKSLFE